MSDDEVVSDDSVDSPGIQEAGSVVPSADVESVQGLESEVPVEEVSGGGVSGGEVSGGEVEEELNEFGFAASDMVGDEEEEAGDEGGGDVSPIEEFVDGVVVEEGEEVEMSWYILKVQVNRENSICDALRRRVKVAGIERFFGEVLVPTEDVREFNKAGKQRIRKRKLYPGYIVVNMAINDDSWFLVRETSGIGDFTGAAGKPAPLTPEEVSRIIATTMPDVEEDGEDNIKTAIPFKVGDRVRVKEGYFQNHEGEVSAVDERNGRITVMINIFGRPNPVELDHWHVENV